MGRSHGLTPEEKLDALKKEWGYAEVSQIVLPLSHWRVWLVKNYTGKPIRTMNGNGLPGNPHAMRKIEYTGHERVRAISEAYNLTLKRKKATE